MRANNEDDLSIGLVCKITMSLLIEQESLVGRMFMCLLYRFRIIFIIIIAKSHWDIEFARAWSDMSPFGNNQLFRINIGSSRFALSRVFNGSQLLRPATTQKLKPVFMTQLKSLLFVAFKFNSLSRVGEFYQFNWYLNGNRWLLRSVVNLSTNGHY